MDIDAPSLDGRTGDLSKRRITSCWKTASPRSRRRRCDATVWKLISRRRCRIGSLALVVRALQALRGMALVAAATVIAELGDITRFANPRQLMAYLGLVPSEHSSVARHDARAASRKPGIAQPDEC